MKEIMYYMCEVCNTEYDNKQKATDCEQHHKQIKKIIKCKYTAKSNDNTGLPSCIIVEFNNEEKASYIRCHTK